MIFSAFGDTSSSWSQSSVSGRDMPRMSSSLAMTTQCALEKHRGALSARAGPATPRFSAAGAPF